MTSDDVMRPPIFRPSGPTAITMCHIPNSLYLQLMHHLTFWSNCRNSQKVVFFNCIQKLVFLVPDRKCWILGQTHLPSIHSNIDNGLLLKLIRQTNLLDAYHLNFYFYFYLLYIFIFIFIYFIFPHLSIPSSLFIKNEASINLNY